MSYGVYIIVLLAIASLTLSFFWYASNKFLTTFLRYFLIFLRATSLTLILILLLNLKLPKSHKIIEKPRLAVLVDDSQSISELKQTGALLQWLDSIKSLKSLSQKYDVRYYSFGKAFKSLSELTFSDPVTNIRNALDQLKNIEGQYSVPLPVLLISDGNQTYGEGYQYPDRSKLRVFPVYIGDTMKYADLKISRVNVNKFVFVNNKFPIEIFINYEGEKRVKSELLIEKKNKIIYRKQLIFSAKNTSMYLKPFIKSGGVGVKTFQIKLKPIKNEKNINNNRRNIGVQVIDNRMKIAIVSNMKHPDIGEFTRALEKSNRHEVSKLTPRVAANNIKVFDVFILYQPDYSFAGVLKKINTTNKNYLLVSGTKTNWSFLNNAQHIISRKTSEVIGASNAVPNLSYSEFSFKDIGFSDFSPLRDKLGSIEFNTIPKVILSKRVNGINISEPLIASVDLNKRRTAYIFGEDIWRWRMQSYIEDKSFSSFDNFLSKLLFYLRLDNSKKKMSVEYKSFYYQGEFSRIRIQFFDKNYEPRLSVRPVIHIKNKETSETLKQLMFFTDYAFQTDLSNLTPGEYNFIIKEQNSAEKFSGSFKIIPFNQEQQFVSTNYNGLTAVAKNTGGSVIYSMRDIQKKILEDDTYVLVERLYKTYFSMIEFWWILTFILLSLFAEWFTRKYIGLT